MPRSSRPAPALIDTVPGDTSSTATLTVDAAPIISAIDTIADEDFYQINLVAGHEYQIGMFGYTPAGPGDPVGRMRCRCPTPTSKSTIPPAI